MNWSKYIIKVTDRPNQDARDYTILQRNGDSTLTLDPERGWVLLSPGAMTRASFTLYGLDEIEVHKLLWQPVEHPL